MTRLDFINRPARRHARQPRTANGNRKPDRTGSRFVAERGNPAATAVRCTSCTITYKRNELSIVNLM
eukprot:4117886-Prymnesium_polylepis.2